MVYFASPQGQAAHAAVVASYDVVEMFQQDRCVTTDLIQGYSDSDFNGVLKALGAIFLVVPLIFTAIGDTIARNWDYAEWPSFGERRVESLEDQEMPPVVQHSLSRLPSRRTPAGHLPEEYSYRTANTELLRAESRHFELLGLTPNDDEYFSVEAFSARSRAYDDRMAQASALTNSELLELTRDDELFWSKAAVLARFNAFDQQLKKAFRPVVYEAPYRRLELVVTGPEAEYLVELRDELETTSLKKIRGYFLTIGSEEPFTQADYSFIEFYLKKAPLEEIKLTVDQISSVPAEQTPRDKMILKAYREKVRLEGRAPKSPARRGRVASPIPERRNRARRRSYNPLLFGQETMVGGKRMITSNGLNFPAGWAD